MGTRTRFEVPKGELLAERYRVEHSLGHGAMGLVVSARDLETGRRVAVKLLHATTNPALFERFRREARALTRIESPHVVRVLDHGLLDDGAPFFVMELLEGHDLAHEMRRRGRLPLGEAIVCILQVCEGLRHVHACGVVHRDIKPPNLFVTYGKDGERVMKIVDFGIAKPPKGLEPTLTDAATTLGSPLYMSPEQVRNPHAIDHRSDLWSVGVVLHVLLTGRAPFDGRGLGELCLAIVGDAPIPLRRELPDVPVAVEHAILRCLEKQPEGRPDDVEELIDQLRPFAGIRGAAEPRAAAGVSPLASTVASLGLRAPMRKAR